MYTELHYNAELKREVPQQILDVLKFMLGDTKRKISVPDHELFEDGSRWMFMLICDSFYFDADTNSTLTFNKISDSYYLCIRCNFKNSHNEIKNFIDWISPYINKIEGGFLGFFRYEEDETPTLIYASGE